MHDAKTLVDQLRTTLAANKLPVGFLLGAGCPCAIRIPSADGTTTTGLIPDIMGLTSHVDDQMKAGDGHRKAAYGRLLKSLSDDGITKPTVEGILNRIRQFTPLAGNATVRGLAGVELVALDTEICRLIREVAAKDLPHSETPYNALAAYAGGHRSSPTEIFTTNYDLLMEQALEHERAPYFDGFIGASKPFFDQRAIEDDKLPKRWSRLWKLHGSINWRLHRGTKRVFRSDTASDGEELLIHPSHLKYDDSRRMPYFIMIDRLRGFLRGGGKPTALIIAGYSFGDEHINEAIVESLKANPSSACFALQYGPLAGYGVGIQLAKANSNLSLLARDQAVIRRRQGPWTIKGSLEESFAKGAFQLPEKTKDNDDDVGDDPRPCEMMLGDFKDFGDFLNDISSTVIGLDAEAQR